MGPTLHFDSVPSTFRFLLSLPQFFSPPTTSHHQLLQWIFRYFFFSVVHWSGIAHSAVARSNEEKLKISFPLFFFSQHVIIFKIYSTSGSLSKQNKTLNKHFRTHYTVVPLVLLHPAHSFTPRTFDLTQVKTQLKIYHQLFFFQHVTSLFRTLPWKEKHKQYLIHFIFLATSCC